MVSSLRPTLARPIFLYGHACTLNRFGLFVTLWTLACLAPLSMGFSRHEYWSGLLCPPPGDLASPGMGPTSVMATCIGRQALYH